VRGASIKVFGIENNNLLCLENKNSSSCDEQDFLLVSSDHFFADNTRDIGDLLHAAFLAEAPSYAMFWYVFGEWNPLSWRYQPLLTLRKMALEGKEMKNPLDWQYYSATPYRLGTSKQAVKYSIKPCHHQAEPTSTVEFNTTDTDFLQKSLSRTLDEEGRIIKVYKSAKTIYF
jgi:hypothetical protein